MKTLLASIVIILGITTIALADSLYRCADGTFTNKAERQCAPYESTGIVRVQPQQPSTEKQSGSFTKVEGARR